VKKTSRPTAASRKRSPRPPGRSPAGPQERALVAFAKLAKRLGIRWYVFGAQAVNLHGFPRATADLDLTIELGTLTPAMLLAKLTSAGFTPRFADPAFIAAAQVIPVVHDATGLPIDLVLAGSGLEQQFLDELVIKRIAGSEVPVLSPENLVITKLLAARPKDLEDIRELLAIQSLDHAHIDRLLKLLEQALDQRDLRELYRKLRNERSRNPDR
jgi:hypothetical protein